MSDRGPTPRRPRGFTPGYGVPQSEDGLVTWEWVVERLERARNYWVATTNPDGSPHTMPVWALWLDDSVVFSTSPRSRKTRNVERDPRAVVHVDGGDEVVILEGEVEATALDDRIARAYEAKYDYRPDPASPEEGWYVLRPSGAYAWGRDFPRSVTRFTFG
jgi:PPOX class probable F420-dependent enzyme